MVIMDIFSKLKETVLGHISSKGGAGADTAGGGDIKSLLNADSTADVSKSSKVLEASANADYSGGLNMDSKTPLNPPNQIIRDAPPQDIPSMPSQNPTTSAAVPSSTVPPAVPPLNQASPLGSQVPPVSDAGMMPGANPTDQAYPQDQTSIAQAAYPAASQPVSSSGSLDTGQIPVQTPVQSPMPLSGKAMPEYPQAPKPVIDMQQQSNMPMTQKIDMAFELRDIKSQINLILEKLNVIEERTRRSGY